MILSGNATGLNQTKRQCIVQRTKRRGIDQDKTTIRHSRVWISLRSPNGPYKTSIPKLVVRISLDRADRPSHPRSAPSSLFCFALGEQKNAAHQRVRTKRMYRLCHRIQLERRIVSQLDFVDTTPRFCLCHTLCVNEYECTELLKQRRQEAVKARYVAKQ